MRLAQGILFSKVHDGTGLITDLHSLFFKSKLAQAPSLGFGSAGDAAEPASSLPGELEGATGPCPTVVVRRWLAGSGAGRCSHPIPVKVLGKQKPQSIGSLQPFAWNGGSGVNRADGGWQPPGWRRAARRPRRNLLLERKLNWQASWAS